MCGFVAMNEKFALYIKWAARPYMFQAGMPPSVEGTVLASLELIQKDRDISKKAHSNAKNFRLRLLSAGVPTGDGTSPIVTILIENNLMLHRVSTELFEAGIFTTAVPKPFTPQNLLRFVYNSFHTTSNVDHTANYLIDLHKKYRFNKIWSFLPSKL